MIHVNTGDVTIDYQPGHVLALEIESDGSHMDESSKVAQDALKNGG